MDYSYVEYLSNKIGLSEDIIRRAAMISMVGNHDLTMNNYDSIVSFDENEIKIITNRERITIIGRHLCISNYNYEEMTINGVITGISFETIN